MNIDPHFRDPDFVGWLDLQLQCHRDTCESEMLKAEDRGALAESAGWRLAFRKANKELQARAKNVLED